MARSNVKYAAGFPETQRFVVALDSSDDAEKMLLVSRFIEFWCQSNCRGRWRVEWSSRLVVSFKSERDIILFKISSEYDAYAGYWQAQTPAFMCA